MTALLTIPGADDDVQRLIGVLDEVGPRGLSAAEMMPRMGIFADDAVSLQSGFVRFCNIVLRAERVLEQNGFWLMRSGGKPSDLYWIEQVRSS